MSLKLKFNPELEYQQDAINAMVDLFKGQTPKQSNFTVTPASGQTKMGESYVKLPNWFKIPTPLGGYNPDWAILINDNGEEKFYFVTETKSTLDRSKLRPSEVRKIECGEEHFKALGGDIKYGVARGLDNVLNIIE